MPQTVALWFTAAILEGIDLQSIGIAGPGITKEFGFDPAQMGWLFSASVIGLVVGSGIGGRLADLRGRKSILVWSVALYGVFSVATALSWDLNALVIMRFLTGVGLGGAMPNLVALVAESVPHKMRSTMVGVMYCGMPLGSALAAVVGALLVGEFGWRIVFYIGGIGPIVIAPLLAALLPESPEYAQQVLAPPASAPAVHTVSNVQVLFGGGRAVATVGLWISFFFILFVLYLMLNWLPALLIDKGFSRAGASALLILFNFGAMGGMVLSGLLLDRSSRGPSIIAMYAALILSMVALGYGSDRLLLAIAVTGTGIFTAAVQIVVYGLAPAYYAPLMRGTGMGWLVAIGRCGSVVGPLAAGEFLAAGMTTNSVLVVGVPGLVLAMIAVLLVLTRPQAS